MIIGTIGRLGKGKTMSAVIEALIHYYAGETIFSNIWLSFPHVPLKEPKDFVSLNNGFAVLDEFWSLADNRKSMSKMNDVITLICIRSRKKKFSIFYTQQYFMIDRRIRHITDYWIRPSLIPDNLSGYPPQILVQEIYDGDWIKKPTQTIDVRPYVDPNPMLYDTDQDPYTLKASLTDENIISAFDRILEKDPDLKEDYEVLKHRKKSLGLKKPKSVV